MPASNSRNPSLINREDLSDRTADASSISTKAKAGRSKSRPRLRQRSADEAHVKLKLKFVAEAAMSDDYVRSFTGLKKKRFRGAGPRKRQFQNPACLFVEPSVRRCGSFASASATTLDSSVYGCTFVLQFRVRRSRRGC